MVSLKDVVVVDHKSGKKYDGKVVMVKDTSRGVLFTVAMNDYSHGIVRYRSIYLDDCVSCLKMQNEGFVSAT